MKRCRCKGVSSKHSLSCLLLPRKHFFVLCCYPISKAPWPTQRLKTLKKTTKKTLVAVSSAAITSTPKWRFVMSASVMSTTFHFTFWSTAVILLMIRTHTSTYVMILPYPWPWLKFLPRRYKAIHDDTDKSLKYALLLQIIGSFVIFCLFY